MDDILITVFTTAGGIIIFFFTVWGSIHRLWVKPSRDTTAALKSKQERLDHRVTVLEKQSKDQMELSSRILDTLHLLQTQMAVLSTEMKTITKILDKMNGDD